MDFLVASLLLVFALLESAAPKNPILPGWNPDPSILRVGSDYFITTSTFEYFPGHPIYHSKDLLNWTLIGHGLNKQSQLPLFGTPSDAGVYLLSNLTWIGFNVRVGAWAPSLRHHDGTFYLVSTIRFVYTCTSIRTRINSWNLLSCSRTQVISSIFLHQD